jgi:hypothetical protein
LNPNPKPFKIEIHSNSSANHPQQDHLKMNRRSLLQQLSALSLGLAGTSQIAFAQQTAEKTKPSAKKKNTSKSLDLAWHNVEDFGLEGREWSDLKRLRYYDRFPAEVEKNIPAPVWSLSRDSAGMMARFQSDSTTIAVRYTLRNERLAMPHMPATGASGTDLYAQDDKGTWRWVYCSQPTGKNVETVLINGIPKQSREFQLYLPLYNGIEKLEIGTLKNAQFQGHAPRPKPLVFYGTSITHGASASRPGMVHTAILGRRLNLPILNLGFSGNGRMDTGVNEMMGKLDAAAYVIDCLPNMGPELVTERTAPLVRQLRAARPETPIILVEDRRNTNSWILKSRDNFHTANHSALKNAYDSLIKSGVKNLYYINGNNLLGDDNDGTVDASHPTDLGFYRQALEMEPVIKKALAR